MPPPLLFVHGLSHGAWCWEEHFVPYFRGRGYDARAINLRHHGAGTSRAGLRFTPLARYVDDVHAAASQLDEPPVLIGHSMGGAIVQKYMSRGGRASAAVLVASVPQNGAFGATVRYAAAHPLRFLAINATLSFKPMVGSPEAFATFLSPRISRAELERLQKQAQDESYRAFVDMLLMAFAKPAPANVPTLVVAGSEDSLFSPRAERRLAAYHGAEFELFEGMGHDLMLDHGWEAVAARIAAFLETPSAA